MSQLVVLSLGKGDLHNGFPVVTAQLWESHHPHPMKFIGSLPAAPEILELYKYWKLFYETFYRRLDWCPRIEIEAADVTNVSEIEFDELCQKFQQRINTWLNSESFQPIDRKLRTHLNLSEEIRIIIETDDNQLRRLPWHLWNLLEDYSQAEVALSSLAYQRPRQSILTKPKIKVKVLAIFGSKKGIDLGKERRLLEQLSTQAEIKFLIEPSPEELNDRLWEGWDMLFFAGHSSSQEKGIIHLNQTDRLTLDQFRFSLKKAIERGLKLAIFNSCDGLGLAQDLADLHLPQVIVMREPVPDKVAQAFFTHFLTAFSSGQSLYAAVREARERLQKLEDDFPCATWLPVICSNPAVLPPTWQDWCRLRQPHPPLLNWPRFQTGLIASLLVTALVMTVRLLGIMQVWELAVYDQLMRLRPPEKPDSRLLIVTVDEADIQYQKQQKMQMEGSLSDAALAQLLRKLAPYKPRVIGLDIYHDFPFQLNPTTDVKLLNPLIAVCKVGNGKNNPGIAPPPKIPVQRLGFTAIPLDPYLAIRRQLLTMTPDATCKTDQSFSLRVALHYLEQLQVPYQGPPDRPWQMGKTVFHKLTPDAGGYQLPTQEAQGYQILLNYRNAEFEQVKLREILNGRMDAQLGNLASNRIILIGVAYEDKDLLFTPYSTGAQPKKMPGVVVHAHMVSQIISAVLDNRPLIKWWPQWVETLWILHWSVVGSLLALFVPSRLHLALTVGVAVAFLYALCFILLLMGSWVPLVPCVLALVVTGSGVAVYTSPQIKPKK